MVSQEHKLLFDIRNLTWGYPHSPSMLFYQTNLSVYSGDFLIVQGKSGVGKSTLIKLLMGQYRVAPKMIWYKHEDLARFDVVEIQTLRRKL